MIWFMVYIIFSILQADPKQQPVFSEAKMFSMVIGGCDMELNTIVAMLILVYLVVATMKRRNRNANRLCFSSCSQPPHLSSL
jgi:hypothetical protein